LLDYEVGCIKSTIECGASNFEMKTGLKLETRIGCTIKTPVMCLRTDKILGVNSVTFDCDNLTQLTYGMSKASSTNIMVPASHYVTHIVGRLNNYGLVAIIC
jgi:phosphoenolpyruvate synthase/pyruvate phosphate dikinase